MLFRMFRKEVRDMQAIFNGHFVDVKAFYAWQFNRIPCVHFIGELNTSRAFEHINERYQYQVQAVYQHAWYNHAEQRSLFNNSIFVLQNDRMIELGPDYAMVLFAPTQYTWANQVIADLAIFRASAPQVRVMGFAREPETN